MDDSDPQFRAVLDHGFVRLVDTMGSDDAICDAARISYGAGTKSVRENRGLIRYLFRHRHTSPIEHCEVKFHIRLPIFVMRQLIRHRTSSVNEYSGRYSEMSDEFYLPDADSLQPQSSDNKQGRAGTLSAMSADGVQWMMQSLNETAHEVYRVLLGDRTGRNELYPNEMIYDPYGAHDPLLDDDFPGIAREIARTVLPVSFYTECYWKQNLWNLMHLLKLRMDSHAQHEIRVYADAMFDLIQPMFPVACEAWIDYLRDAVTVSRMEAALLRDLLHGAVSIEAVAPEQYGMTKREMSEFVAQFGLAK